MKYFIYIKKILNCLNKLEVESQEKGIIKPDEGFQWLLKQFKLVKETKKQVFLIGNGASASMASHTALDLWKNFKIKATAFNDVVGLTAISNDHSYKKVFSKHLEFFGQKGDMIICISSSGNSPNILETVKVAMKKQIVTVTLSGMNSNNKLRKMGHLNFYVPANTYGTVESCHQILFHYWLDELLKDLKNC